MGWLFLGWLCWGGIAGVASPDWLCRSGFAGVAFFADGFFWAGLARVTFARMTWPWWLLQDDFPGVALPRGPRSAHSQCPDPPGFVPWSRRRFLRLPGAGGPGLALVAPGWRGALGVGAAAPWQLRLRQLLASRIHPHSQRICCRRSASTRGRGGGGRVPAAPPSPLGVPQPAMSPSTTAARTRCPTAPR